MTRLDTAHTMHQDNSDNAAAESTPASPSAGLELEALLPRQMRVVLVCDVVESVRWMEHDEDTAIARWSQFAASVRSRIAPEHAGSVVKSTGDGLMLEFESAPQAVAAANALHKLAQEGNASYAAQAHDAQMHLRIGIHQAQVRRDAHDLYGHGVNLAARITTLAGPGEIIVTPEVRDHLTDSLDGEIEDMGECYLKHLTEPQRVYRVGEMGDKPILQPQNVQTDILLPKIAVLPLELAWHHAQAAGIASLITDNLTDLLSRQKSVRVVSALSSKSLAGRQGISAQSVTELTACHYIVSGKLNHCEGEPAYKASFSLQLIDAKTQEIIWFSNARTHLSELLAAEIEAIQRAVQDILAALEDHHARIVRIASVPALPAYTLMSAAIHGMHRRSPAEFARAKEWLQALVERYPRYGALDSWLAKWHVLQAGQSGMAAEPAIAQQALHHAQRSVDLTDGDSTAVAMLAVVQSNLVRDFIGADENFNKAIAGDPNNSIAWLYKGAFLTYINPGSEAVQCCIKALELSPIDPIKYIFDGMLGTAYFGEKSYELALESSKLSLRQNAMHLSAMRVLAMSYAMLGDQKKAQVLGKKLLEVNPTFNKTEYLLRFSQSPNEFIERLDTALSIAGVPN
jgi:adenylate cyclase